MALFKKMKDPVRGTAEVVAWETTRAGADKLRLIINADGVPPTPVEYTSRLQVHRNRMPIAILPFN